jgi:hypothetical protein
MALPEPSWTTEVSLSPAAVLSKGCSCAQPWECTMAVMKRGVAPSASPPFVDPPANCIPGHHVASCSRRCNYRTSVPLCQQKILAKKPALQTWFVVTALAGLRLKPALPTWFVVTALAGLRLKPALQTWFIVTALAGLRLKLRRPGSRRAKVKGASVATCAPPDSMLIQPAFRPVQVRLRPLLAGWLRANSVTALRSPPHGQAGPARQLVASGMVYLPLCAGRHHR